MRLMDNIRIGGKVLGGKILSRRVPLSVEFGITYQCGLACKYCFSDHSAHYSGSPSYLQGEEMTLPQIRKTLSLLGRLGVERINLSGGEPLCRQDIDEILGSALVLKSKISLTTNGLLVPRYLDMLSRLDFLCISINGTKATHNYLAGAETHDAVMRAIALAKERKIQLFLSAVIADNTQDEDVAFLLKLADHYDIHCLFQPVFGGAYFEEGYVAIPKLRAVIPTASQTRKLFTSMKGGRHAKRVVGGRAFIEFILNTAVEGAGAGLAVKRCSAGENFFYISPSGVLMRPYVK